MAEYLAPGVYVEETSFRAKSIEGVGTSTTAFVGPTVKGPTAGPPELLTSFGDFQRLYGGLDNLSYGTNYIAHAVLAFFNEGGGRLYVARVAGSATAGSLVVNAAENDAKLQAVLKARFAGSGCNGSVSLREVVTPASSKTLDTAPAGSLVRATTTNLDKDGKVVATTSANFFKTGPGAYLDSSDAAKVTADVFAAIANPAPPADGSAVVSVALVTLTVEAVDGGGASYVFENLGFGSGHPRYVGTVLGEKPLRHIDDLQNPYALVLGSDLKSARLVYAALLGGQASASLSLSTGSDGSAPSANDYSDALLRVAALEDVSIVAAPAAAAHGVAQDVNNALIIHASARRAYRIAVLDTPQDFTLGDARSFRGQFDSTYAALYYPWVVVPNPLAKPGRDDIAAELVLPPSGFMCGVYARTDVNRGVWKAPANEVVQSARRFEVDVNFGQQEVLNPIGVNCLRALSGRGNRVWGARTISSDPEWKYVNVRRYFLYLEASIDRGTQWAVFEPNGERLWGNVTQTISDFLYNEWKSGALLGTSPEQAFFVRCDRSTMTQNDLDNGRLICLVGVAALKPAEFVIFRIGQKTADDRS